MAFLGFFKKKTKTEDKKCFWDYHILGYLEKIFFSYTLYIEKLNEVFAYLHKLDFRG